MSQQRKRILLIGGLVVALVVTLFFGSRFVRRILFRPSREPIREWMSVGYIARAYGVPPIALEQALGLPPGPPPDRRPISEIAKAQNKTTTEVIAIVEKAIEASRPPRPPTRQPPPPTLTPSPS